LRARGVPLHGVAFVGEPIETTEATIARIGGVRRLGRLPILPEVKADALRATFAANFDAGDFA
jgi:dethiobiotin synthetase